MGSTNTEPDHSEDNICSYQAYLTNCLSPLTSHTREVFLPKSTCNELTDKLKKLIIAQNKNVGSSSPCSPTTLSHASHTPPISTKPVISHQVKVHGVEEMFETPSADPPTKDHHQDPLLAMVHDSLSQPEISDSSDIAQLLSVNKSTTQKDSKCIAKLHRQYVFARVNKAATELIDRGTNGGLWI